MRPHWLHAHLERGMDAQDDAERSVFVASTADVDRAGDIVEQDWHLEDYRRNPVVLWAHRYDVAPVGRAEVEVVEGRLLARVHWDTASEVGAEVLRQVRHGFLSAVSVGFRPGEALSRRMLHDEDSRKGVDGYVYRQNRLLEISVVPVPANPQALVVSRSVGVELVDACVQRGLPAPGEAGPMVDAILRTMPARIRTALVDDEGFVASVAARVADALAKGAPPPADPWAGYFPAPPSQWAGWFAPEE